MAEQQYVDDSYNRSVNEVELLRDNSFASSESRHLMYSDSDARVKLREGYNAVLKHMQENPALAPQDAAMVRQFQKTATEEAFNKNLSEDARDNMFAGMLKLHANGSVPERSVQTESVLEQ
jgi:transglutaminase/protease-like cytokinesis protein 3